MPIVMLRIAAKSASVAVVLLEILIVVVMSHHDRYASQIHVHQMANVLFKKMVNQFVSAHSEWEEIQLQQDVMDTNVTMILIVQKITLA